jgi:hypothetical protein
MVLNATFNNIPVILWRSALLMEETGVAGKKPPTCYKSLTNFITYCCIEYTSPVTTGKTVIHVDTIHNNVVKSDIIGIHAILSRSWQ